MNPDVLLNRIRLEQRGLIDIHKKLYEMEHLLPAPDPMQFAKTAESAALLSEKSTARLRNMFFSVSNEPPIYYYPKAAEVQGIRVEAHLILGKSYRQIAQEQDVDKSVVRRSVKRGMAAMKKYLKKVL